MYTLCITDHWPATPAKILTKDTEKLIGNFVKVVVMWTDYKNIKEFSNLILSKDTTSLWV